VAIAPGCFAQVFPAESVTFAIKQSVEYFARHKWSLGCAANLRTLFDWPVGRQGIYHRANIRRGRRPRKSEGARLEERNGNKERRIVPKTIVGAQAAIGAGTRSPSTRG